MRNLYKDAYMLAARAMLRRDPATCELMYPDEFDALSDYDEDQPELDEACGEGGWSDEEEICA